MPSRGHRCTADEHGNHRDLLHECRFNFEPNDIRRVLYATRQRLLGGRRAGRRPRRGGSPDTLPMNPARD